MEDAAAVTKVAAVARDKAVEAERAEIVATAAAKVEAAHRSPPPGQPSRASARPSKTPSSTVTVPTRVRTTPAASSTSLTTSDQRTASLEISVG